MSQVLGGRFCDITCTRYTKSETDGGGGLYKSQKVVDVIFESPLYFTDDRWVLSHGL